MLERIDDILNRLDPGEPVLIAGPTASGKSALALAIAEAQGGRIINADALQVYADWRILTARPGAEDLARAPHALYGHVPGDRPYSVGDWLRDLKPLLDGPRPIVTGGTGLYFTALTEGLADIPPTPPGIRARADARLAEDGPEALLAELDPETAARIDRQNPVRIQRAWEVLRTTGRGLAAWQDETGPPLLPLADTQPLLLTAERDWLTPRIERRFDAMLAEGVLDEARANRASWRPDLPSAKAIGAAELMAHLDGHLSLDALKTAVSTLTRQYAKRQRTWFRSRLSAWPTLPCH
ncbi:tRNA (adenosine(37)-N6)-dimethylallyltransferase MiaA [Ovoidimarina sediminis]|uniref:tRNA (adenosine(37)-N6)-dimethylallyltransferase MiaA n=1 Tax=Ovoidimarina sediminis TaxID=3079856 RepID=UPI002911AFAD|nr:tRNA (adenosine(37)-N6)-dimethylallyltransferase MiaA [Rhodophyticola sp. MJ-SS7]MDU8941914.1 tRNA (adenosine(37)-N6)-dimethylallyltransferase MiaA [Rhodophyticola sp. MJ-SS7]